jgi:DUF2959 family protein
MKRAGLTVALLLVVRCATSAPDRSVRTASTLEAMQQNSMKARLQIDAVLSSLEGLLNAEPDRLRKAYDRYDGDVKKMKDYANAIRENDADLKKNGSTYLNQWQKDASSVSNPELRALAERRQNEIADKTRSMKSTISTAAQSFAGFLRDIDDIHKVISNDLTPTGQASVKNTTIAQTVQQEGAQVKTAIQNAEQSIADVRLQITPTAK